VLWAQWRTHPHLLDIIGVLAIGSNAALHWVLRDDAARLREVFEELFTALSHAELQQQQQ
jgi:hypothetical protein